MADDELKRQIERDIVTNEAREKLIRETMIADHLWATPSRPREEIEQEVQRLIEKRGETYRKHSIEADHLIAAGILGGRTP